MQRVLAVSPAEKTNNTPALNTNDVIVQQCVSSLFVSCVNANCICSQDGFLRCDRSWKTCFTSVVWLRFELHEPPERVWNVCFCSVGMLLWINIVLFYCKLKLFIHFRDPFRNIFRKRFGFFVNPQSWLSYPTDRSRLHECLLHLNDDLHNNFRKVYAKNGFKNVFHKQIFPAWPGIILKCTHWCMF